jgi:tripartite-type tricarboxylate transporter receptor subunit TctC
MRVNALKRAIACVALTVSLALPATAQDYPSRTVRILAGFGPGSATDIVARLMASQWSKLLNGQFVVENRPGAASAIAAEMVARAPKDGTTLLLGGPVNLSSGLINPAQTWDPMRDFAPVVVLAGQPMILAVHPSLNVSTLAEFIALAKSKPGELSYGSTGVGGQPHLFTELFAVRTGTKMVHVPYQGSPQAVTDLLAGRVHFMFSPAAAVLPHIQSGALKGLATTSGKRSGVVPNLPTMIEAGAPDIEATLWFAIWAPAGTPREVIDKLNRSGNEAIKSAEAQQLFKTQGFDPLGGTPEDFARLVAKELEKWTIAVQAAGLKK